MPYVKTTSVRPSVLCLWPIISHYTFIGFSWNLV